MVIFLLFWKNNGPDGYRVVTTIYEKNVLLGYDGRGPRARKRKNWEKLLKKFGQGATCKRKEKRAEELWFTKILGR